MHQAHHCFQSLYINMRMPCMKHRALRHRPDNLMSTLRYKVCPCIQCLHWQLGTKLQMGTMRFVHNEFHPIFMYKFCNRLYIRSYPIIRRIDNQHRFRLRMIMNCFGNLLWRYCHRNPKCIIDLRHGKNRLSPA